QAGQQELAVRCIRNLDQGVGQLLARRDARRVKLNDHRVFERLANRLRFEGLLGDLDNVRPSRGARSTWLSGGRLLSPLRHLGKINSARAMEAGGTHAPILSKASELQCADRALRPGITRRRAEEERAKGFPLRVTTSSAGCRRAPAGRGGGNKLWKRDL